ncbi:MAG: tRNA (guanosine(46)-N7)-methyltransferase TrmB [Oscillospiraceae bacterium]|nr:tRNA (guanosine(46)-N7)-methyltransferase TrmB [Oscillospiraceae bacterium]
MRMRRKPYARPELAACSFFAGRPAEFLGRWRESFPNPDAPFEIELGCGKGGFISKLASQNPDKNFLGIDIKSEVLVLAKRKVEAAYAQAGLAINNIRLMSQDIERIGDILDERDPVDCIYINFCNPWSKSGHQKRRLTHTRQLIKYRSFLKAGGEIRFKTDDDGLFEDSLRYFDLAGFSISYLTRDLHADAPDWNIETEHEQMFSQEGIPIKALIAVMNKPPKAEAFLKKGRKEQPASPF